jgi:sugar phosphate isomerase/epimerase
MITRRAFLAGSAAAGLALPALGQDGKPPWKVGGFTKNLQDLNYERTAEAAVEIGWDGIECPVRAKGHVLPERVEEDLPRMAEALKAKGRELLVLATDIRGADDPLAAKLVKTSVKLGCKLYRLGPLRYKEGVSIPQQLNEFKARLKDLAALNRETGATGLVQNHSGNGYVGASLWDLHELLKDFDPKELGVHFDIGHATVEQGLSWPTAWNLVKDRVGAVIVKDFHWQHTPGQGQKTVWGPIGKGAVSPKFFPMLKASACRGPITAQFEYRVQGDEAVEARIRAMKTDHQTIVEWLRRA